MAVLHGIEALRRGGSEPRSLQEHHRRTREAVAVQGRLAVAPGDRASLDPEVPGGGSAL
jgi:hypothetical protein